MDCKFCGTHIEEGDSFCTNCGKSIYEKKKKFSGEDIAQMLRILIVGLGMIIAFLVVVLLLTRFQLAEELFGRLTGF